MPVGPFSVIILLSDKDKGAVVLAHVDGSVISFEHMVIESFDIEFISVAKVATISD